MLQLSTWSEAQCYAQKEKRDEKFATLFLFILTKLILPLVLLLLPVLLQRVIQEQLLSL